MIIARLANKSFRCITQHEHGKVAGLCAMQWGSGEFESLTPDGSVVTAVFTHDIGWQEFDQRPRIKTDQETGNYTPVNFYELPPQTWVEMYEQGIDTVASIDPYAGLLISLHGVGLQNRRYGLAPDWSGPSMEFRGFIQREQERQRELMEDLSKQGDSRVSSADRTTLTQLQNDNQNPERYTGRLWCNYKLLQALDTLSHILCATTNPTVDATIEHTPVSVDTDVSLEIRSEAANTYQLDPYPFTRDPLVIPAIGRTVSEQTISSGDEQAIAREYFTNTNEIEFQLHS